METIKIRLSKMKKSQKDIILEMDGDGNWNCTSHAVQTAGYPIIMLDNKQYLLHRAIWEDANGAIPSGLEISHINHNKLDCRLQNLELISHLENIRKKSENGTQNVGSRHGIAKLCESDVLEIRKDDRLLREIAVDYNISTSILSKIKNGLLWKHI